MTTDSHYNPMDNFFSLSLFDIILFSIFFLLTLHQHRLIQVQKQASNLTYTQTQKRTVTGFADIFQRMKSTKATLFQLFSFSQFFFSLYDGIEMNSLDPHRFILDHIYLT